MTNDCITYRDGKEILLETPNGEPTLWLEPDPEDETRRIAFDADYLHDNGEGVRLAHDVTAEELTNSYLIHGSLLDAIDAVTDLNGSKQTDDCRQALKSLTAAADALNGCPEGDDLRHKCEVMRREMLTLRDAERHSWNANIHLQVGRAHIGADEIG